MKQLSGLTLSCVLLGTTSPLFADSLFPPTGVDNSLQKISEYLLHLGGYLGYDLKKEAPDKAQDTGLIDATGMQVIENYAFNTLLGAIPVTSTTAALSRFVPSQQTYNAINSFANYTFNNQGYNSDSMQQGKVSVTGLIDQKTYQNDPVSQGILNILATPNLSYCMSYDGKTWDKDCKFLYQSKVMTNILGPIPKPQEYFDYKYIQSFLPQLNSNALIAPLLYSLSAPESTSSPLVSNQDKDKGLTAVNQGQTAANFVRYASGEALPIPLPQYVQYSELYNKATNSGGKTSPAEQKISQSVLATYFAALRVYAAQTSVGISNLYYILSKRLPQNQSATGKNMQSQAMSEFTMATRRLYDPQQKEAKDQWISRINNASPSTVQKEIAILLAEMNYQLYLNRQQGERLLLTNSILLLQNARSFAAQLDLKMIEDSVSSTTGSGSSE